MIEIEINANNNMLTIKDDKARLSSRVEYPYELKNHLCEIFNRIDNNLALGTFLYVTLTYIDEDTKSTIGEW